MSTPLTIGVIGAGTMGRGIVQLFAQAGHRVHCFDAAEGCRRLQPALEVRLAFPVVPVEYHIDFPHR